VDCLVDVAREIGWWVSCVDGHKLNELIPCLEADSDAPHMVIASTIKGKGVGYMEGIPKWHACWPNPEEEKIAMAELS
jgi:transketolase